MSTRTAKLIDPDSFYVKMQIDFAVEYGVNEAILAGKMFRLQEKMKGKIDDKGKKWVRLTLTEWHTELPFFSEPTIRRTIESCEKQKILLSRTFKGRSKWYRLNDDFVEVPEETEPATATTDQSDQLVSDQNDQIQLIKMISSSDQNDQLPRVLSNSPNPTVQKEGASATPITDKKPKSEKKPAAVHVYRENAHLWPVKSTWVDLDRAIGNSRENLELWGQIVKAWIMCGWNPKNTKGMLEFFSRKEIPSTGGKNGTTNNRRENGLQRTGADLKRTEQYYYDPAAGKLIPAT